MINRFSPKTGYLLAMTIFLVAGNVFHLSASPDEQYRADEERSESLPDSLSSTEYRAVWNRAEIRIDCIIPEQCFEPVLMLEKKDAPSGKLMVSRIGKHHGTVLLWVEDSEVFPIELQPDFCDSVNTSSSPDTLSLSVVFFPGRDSAYITSGTVRYSLQSSLFKERASYRIGSVRPSSIRILSCHSEIHDSRNPGRHISTWWWFAFVLLVDMLVFAGSYLHRRSQIRKGNATADTDLPAQEKHEVILPKSNAVYLLGELHIYDADGKDIVSQLSPLLRELFLLLVIKSASDGISSEELTSILWFDKDKNNGSAGNNRAVNISKLRSIISNVGNASISKVAGKWKLCFDDSTFVDYYEVLPDKLYASGVSHDRVRILEALTHNGGLMAIGADYQWLDQYKNNSADSLIDILLQYSAMLGDTEAFETKLRICDIISRLDPVNEPSLRLRCRTYVMMNRQYMAKSAYESFCREYDSLYGEPFKYSFTSIISQ